MNYASIKRRIAQALDLDDQVLGRVRFLRVPLEAWPLNGYSNGLCDWREHFPRHTSEYTIYIRNDLSGRDFVQTLAHELRHVWQWEHWLDKWANKDLPYEERPSEIDANEFAAAFTANWENQQ